MRTHFSRMTVRRPSFRRLVGGTLVALVALVTGCSPRLGQPGPPSRGDDGSSLLGSEPRSGGKAPLAGSRPPTAKKRLPNVALLFGSGEGPELQLLNVRTTQVRDLHVPALHNYPSVESVSSWSAPILEGGVLALTVGPENGAFPPRALALRLGDPNHAVFLGTAGGLFSALAPGVVWLTSDRRARDGSVRERAWRVQLNGHRLGATIAITGSAVAATRGGLISFDRESDTRYRIQILDPATGKVVRVLTKRAAGPPIAASNSQVVWRDGPYGCTACRVHLFDTVAGQGVVIHVPPKILAPFVSCSFSPDGSVLALSFTHGGGGGGPVVLVHRAGRSVRVVRGSRGANPDLAAGGVVWAPSGRSFFFLADTARWSPPPVSLGIYTLGSSIAKKLRTPKVLPSVLYVAARA